MAIYPERIQKALDRARAHIAANAPLLALPDVEKAIAKVPKGADGWYLMGQIKGMQEDHVAAEKHFRRAAAIAPKSYEVLFGLGLALTQQQRFIDAIQIFQRAIAGDPLPPIGALHNLGSCHLQLGNYAAAVEIFSTLLARRVDTSDIHALLGMAHQGMNDHAAALNCYRAAAARGLHGYTVNLNSGACAFGLQDFDPAQRYAQAALDAAPEDAVALRTLAAAQLAAGDVADAIVTCQRSTSPATTATRLLAMSYLDRYSAEEIRDAHRQQAAAYPRPLPPLAVDRAATADRIRLGFVSGDLRHHPVAYFLEGLLAAVDRTQFDLHIYSTVAEKDAITERFMALECSWHDVAGWSDDAIAAAIRDERIDIAFDLAGNTGNAALGVFAMRAAPVQVSYLGYSATTGLPEMDYFMTDEILGPPGSDADFSEKLVRLGRVFASYTPPAAADPGIGALPLETNGYATFASFAQACKITPTTLALWGQALRAVPDARLLLQSKGMQHAAAQERMLARLEAVGIERHRVDLRGAALLREYLAAHNEVDVILDTVPWNGHTTTLHALWMGVPTLSVPGARHVGRFAEMVQRALEPASDALPPFIAPSAEAFGAAAAQLVADPARLAALRRSLRSRLLASPLCDHQTLARRFEAACQAMHQTFLSGSN